MDLQQYCALRNRTRFYVDPIQDAHWFFGNREVEQALIARIEADLDVRGVPKCGIGGRFGIGKTHTLNHVRWLVESEHRYPFRAFMLDVVWDEGNKELNSWRNVHCRMLDALGEDFIRDVVRQFEKNVKDPDIELSDALFAKFRFGDVNLKRSLATVLADYFKREVKSTVPAWQWLKADPKANAQNLQVPKLVNEAADMVFTILNIGSLHSATSGQKLVFLMDEAQNLGNVRKADAEVHRGFLKLADPDNVDVGFVLAAFGGGTEQIPKVLTTPQDILSRLGVTPANINDAFILLQKVLQTEAHIREFMNEVLDNLVDVTAASALITDHALDGVAANRIPFTEAALARIAKALANREENRNPRLIIDTMARACSRAYHTGREAGKYALVDTQLVDPIVASF